MPKPIPPRSQGGMPRGLATEGPVLFSYGFRPFFLGAAIWAVVAMALWIASLSGHASFAEDYGTVFWHAHEMLFGFAPAILTGYLLTTVPNWTGHLPVSGRPLICLFLLWCAGRLALLTSDEITPIAAMAIDGLFLPALAFLCGREILRGRKWKDAPVVVMPACLALANLAFHACVLRGLDTAPAERFTLALYILLIVMVSGRIVPAATNSFLKQRGLGRLIAKPEERFIAPLGAITLIGWTLSPGWAGTAITAGVSALLLARRQARWRSLALCGEPILLAMHIAHGFLCAGFAAIALTEWLPPLTVTHFLAIGAMTGMMLAVTMQTIRRHTGKPSQGSALDGFTCACLWSAALLRAIAEMLPHHAALLLTLAGAGWIMTFGLFLVQYGPMLVLVRREPRHNHSARDEK